MPAFKVGSTRTTSKPPITRERKLKLLASYAPDWIITIVLTVALNELPKIHGFWRDFSLNDETIQYRYVEHERVTDTMLIIYSLIIPLVLMPLINMVSIRSFWDFHNSWLGLVLSWGLTRTITNIAKIVAGRPRPDLIARCQPTTGAHNPPVYGLVDWTICTQTDTDILSDGFRSFFSGHASAAFAGLGFLFFYIAGKLHLHDQKGQALKMWLAPIPLMGASLIGITRTMDYRHHPSDVILGSLLGIVVAYFSYRQYFPELNHPLCHRPYSPRIPRETDSDQKQILPPAGVDDTVERDHTELRTIWKDGSTAEHQGTINRPGEDA